MSDRLDRAIPEISDSISIMSSNFDEKVYLDIWISAYIEDPSKEEFFRGTLDTGAQQDLISENVVANRWGMERIDTTKSCLVNDVGMSGIRTLGQIRITLRFAPGVKELQAAFQVVPKEVVANRFDALLSVRLIERRNILLLNPALHSSRRH